MATVISFITSLLARKKAKPDKQALLEAVLSGAAALGLPQRDVQNAQDMFDYAEWVLGFDIIATQLFEFEIEITEQYFALLEQTATILQIPPRNYSFIKALLRSPTHIPSPVGRELILLLQLLRSRER